MNIRFLRHVDRLLGPLLLLTLAPIVRLALAFLPAYSSPSEPGTYVFLKLKGGGSLIVALPALLAIRRATPKAEFTLVCTQETKIYAELTGIFDRYAVIDDRSPLTLAQSAYAALQGCFRAHVCVDLEANSILAAVFGVMTMAPRRIGLVKPEESYRAYAYTDPLSFNVFAAIYVYYDQMAVRLGAALLSMDECRAHFLKQIPAKPKADHPAKVIGIAAFTSDFAPERMMPTTTWTALLQRHLGMSPAQIQLYGSEKNKKAAEDFITATYTHLPNVTFINLCGQGSLAEAVSNFAALDEFWSVDSGLLHIARLIGINCRSFWGPTNPIQRLRPIDGVDEITFYHNFICSPCVHIQGSLPCKGNNLCMKTMAESDPNRAPIWLA